MRNLLALLAAVVLACSGAGIWRGWYHVEMLPAEPGHTAFRIEIDRLKVAEDVGATAMRIIHALKPEQPDKTSPEPAAKP